jgi:hypothetical protein
MRNVGQIHAGISRLDFPIYLADLFFPLNWYNSPFAQFWEK